LALRLRCGAGLVSYLKALCVFVYVRLVLFVDRTPGAVVGEKGGAPVY